LSRPFDHEVRTARYSIRIITIVTAIPNSQLAAVGVTPMTRHPSN